jgi:hypothetical protein
VLASFDTANALPAWAPVRVLAGHGPESAGLAEILPEIEAFYGKGDKVIDRLGFLERYGVSLVFWGPAERALGGWAPDEEAFLKQSYHDGEYLIYEVVDP